MSDFDKIWHELNQNKLLHSDISIAHFVFFETQCRIMIFKTKFGGFKHDCHTLNFDTATTKPEALIISLPCIA